MVAYAASTGQPEEPPENQLVSFLFLHNIASLAVGHRRSSSLPLPSSLKRTPVASAAESRHPRWSPHHNNTTTLLVDV